MEAVVKWRPLAGFSMFIANSDLSLVPGQWYSGEQQLRRELQDCNRTVRRRFALASRQAFGYFGFE